MATSDFITPEPADAPAAAAVVVRRRNRAPCLIAVAAVALSLLVVLHVPGVNGPWYWAWTWVRIPPLERAPWIILAAVPLLVAQWLFPRRLPAPAALALVTASFVAMQFAAARRADDPLALRRVVQVVGDPAANSYFRQAGPLLHDGTLDRPRWLAQYPALMRNMWLHAETHPPGAVLFYVPFIRYFGFTRHAALAGGLAMAALSALSIPATYLMLRALVRDRPDAAFHGVSLLALSPGILLFFPTWDQVLPAFTAATVGFWVRAVDSTNARYAVAFGLALAVASFFTFNLLVLGVFLGVYALLRARDRRRSAGLRLTLRLAAAAVATCAGAYVLFGLATGYNPVATLRSAIGNQHRFEAVMHRPYPLTIPFDLLDFALGSGWVAFLLTAAFLYRRYHLSPGAPARPGRRRLRLTLITLLQLLTVAATGLLAVETARVWIFLLPLLMIPAALELSYWSPRDRLLVHLSLLLILLAVSLNIAFIWNPSG